MIHRVTDLRTGETLTYTPAILVRDSKGRLRSQITNPKLPPKPYPNGLGEPRLHLIDVVGIVLLVVASLLTFMN